MLAVFVASLGLNTNSAAVIIGAMLIGVVLIMRFRKHEFIDHGQEKRVKRIVSAAVLVTLIPAIILTVGMVRENTFVQRVRHFVQHERFQERTGIVALRIVYE